MIFDDYLSCTSYENQPAHAIETEFAAFYHAASGRHFFALLDANGETLLRSEGYPEEKARNNGIQSVLKNRGLVERYKIVEDKGEFFVVLRAGNRQEIARSCPLESKAEAEAFIVALTNAKAVDPKGAEAGEMIEDLTGEAEVPAAEAMMVEAVTIEMDETELSEGPAEETVYAMTAIADDTTDEGAAEEAIEEETAEKVAVAEGAVDAELQQIEMQEVFGVEMPDAETIASVEATYLPATTFVAYAPIDLYMGHPTLHDAYGPTGYALFDGTDGHYYFAVYNPDTTIFLRSQAFNNPDSRNETFAAVQRNITQSGQYSVVEEGTQFAYVLSDESGREISRSPEFNTFTEAFRHTPAGSVRVEGVVLY